MNSIDNYTGYIHVYDWEHDGDYDYPESLLDSVAGVTITERENHGDGNTAYIFFECNEKAIIPLLIFSSKFTCSIVGTCVRRMSKAKRN